VRRSFHCKLITLLVAFGGLAATSRLAAADGDGAAAQYLERARRKLKVVNVMIGRGMDREGLCTCADAQSTSAVCLALRGLTPEQATLCKAVIVQTADRVAALATSNATVPFAVSADSLYVEDPFGNKMEVSAGTSLGPEGPILVSYDRLLSMSPLDLLSLLGHEFHHKAFYPAPGQFITDNDPIGAFAFPGGGRRLLDAIGAGLAWYAYQHGLIGETLATIDHYACNIAEATTGLDFQAMGGSARSFSDGGKTYETGVGNWPSDFGCSIGVLPEGELLFRVKIHEETACSPAGSTTRWTTLELWRSDDGATSDAPTRLTRLARRQIPGWNPLCEKTASRQMAISHREGQGVTAKTYTFTVQYLETTGPD
jgi:hypothetical protein